MNIAKYLTELLASGWTVTIDTTCNLREFCAQNSDLAAEDLTAVRRLAPGGSVELGGGATPAVTVTRIDRLNRKAS